MELIEEIKRLRKIALQFDLYEEYLMLVELQEQVEAETVIYH